MRLLLAVIVFVSSLTAGFGQTLPVKFGKPFKNPALKIEWKPAATNLPNTIWTYKLLPKQFSENAVSNLLSAGDLTLQNQKPSERGTLLFQRPDGSASLWISPKLGEIQFERTRTYGPTNLAVDVPEMNALFRLTTNFMALVDISTNDVEKKANGSADFHFWEPLTMFAESNKIVTNIAFRGARFRRSVDGASFVGNGTGGDCDIQFGEHGVVSRVWMTWRNLEKQQQFRIASPDQIADWIRKGHAVQGRTRVDAPPINWKTAKELTIMDSRLCYYAGNREQPSDFLIPFIALWATVATAEGQIDVEIDAPIVDTKKSMP
jgi:hypothetical protein